MLEDVDSQLRHPAYNKEMGRQATRTHIGECIRADPLHRSSALQSTHGRATYVEPLLAANWISRKGNSHFRDVNATIN